MDNAPAQPHGPSRAPLAGVTVLDLTIAYSGPLATLFLAGLGARVIKVENPATGDPCRTNPPYFGATGTKFVNDDPEDMSIPFINRSRNKLGITLDLRHAQGRKVFLDLVRQADVLVENFSPGVMERLDLGYETLQPINPGLIYCSINGYGSDLRGDDAKAFDILVQARSGIMLAAGTEGGPPQRVGIPIGDLQAPLFAIIGILSALNHRRNTGEGQRIEAAMMDALTALVAGEHFDVFVQSGMPYRTGNSLARMVPFGVFPASDGWVSIAAPFQDMAHNLFRVMGREDMITDPRFATRNSRVLNLVELDAVIAAWSRNYTRAELLALLNPGGVPTTVVQPPEVAVREPRLLDRKAVVPLSHPTLGAPVEVMGAGLPIKFSTLATGFTAPAPFLGQHNDHVLREVLGYTPERIAEIKSSGAI